MNPQPLVLETSALPIELLPWTAYKKPNAQATETPAQSSLRLDRMRNFLPNQKTNGKPTDGTVDLPLKYSNLAVSRPRPPGNGLRNEAIQ